MTKYALILTVLVFLSYSRIGCCQIIRSDSLKLQLLKCRNTADSVSILSQLTWSISEKNSSESIYYGKLALQKVPRLKDSSLISDAYDAAALAFRLEGNLSRSKAYYQKSLRIARRINLEYRIAWANYNLAGIYEQERNSGAFRSCAKVSFRYFLKINNRSMAYKIYSSLVKDDPAINEDTLNTYIERYLQPVTDESDRIFLYLDLSYFYDLHKDKKRAMNYVQRSMELAEKYKDAKGIIKAYYQIADYFETSQHNYAMALTYYKKIYEMYQQQNMANQGDILMQIGDMYRLTGKDSLALQYFIGALETGKKNRHRHTMASAYMKLGDYSYSHRQYPEALNYYLQCYETNCDVCPKIKFHDALINIGNVYLFSGDFQNAGKYYRKGLQIADSASNVRCQALSWQALATLYEKQGNLTRAINYNLKSLGMLREIRYLEGQYDNCNILSSLYKKLHNYPEAFTYLTLANELRDSIEHSNEIDNQAQLETYFDFKNLQIQKELENTKAKEEISRQKLVRNFSITGFILISILGLLIFNGYRRKRKANILLSEQKQAIEKMSLQVHTADQAKLEFYTNVSHEFKTPLTIILGMTEKLSEIRNHNNSISLIRKNALKLLQLVNHLLDLRKIDTSKMELAVQKSNISSFVKGVISSFDTLIQQKQLKVTYTENESDIQAYFDHEKLEKIVANLLSNAIKYNHNGGFIKADLNKRKDGFVEIKFSDSGIGIADHELRNIFERFYRVNGTDNRGSGIGLALVKELVAIHKGEIKVTSVKNEGSSFTVIIPVEKQYYSEHEITGYDRDISSWHFIDVSDGGAGQPDERSFSEPDPLKKTILIVEDNFDLRRYIAEIFRDEYEVIEAIDGAEGYKKSHEFIPDIVISDIMMPKINGLQLIGKLRNDMATSHIPIILLTAKNDIATHLDSFEKGADDFISKPFDSSILKSRVENLLRLRKQLVEKFSQQYQLQPREISIEDSDHKFLQKTIDIIEKNMANPNLNVELLSFELGVSRTQLYRKLNALTDYPPKNFIRIIRLKRAAQILEQGQNNIAEVMDATGFSNYTYFNSCFRDFFGKYPKDYGIVHIKGNLN